MRGLLAFLLSMAMGAAALAGTQAWQAYLWPEHQTRVLEAREIANDWRQRFANADFDPQGMRLLAELLDAPTQVIRPESLSGRWRLRSIQTNSLGVYVYPYFRADIELDAQGLRLRKAAGSQRRLGHLYPVEDAPDSLVFLGGLTMNDSPQRFYSRSAKSAADGPLDSDSAGVLQALGPDHLLLILDAASGEGFELYEMRR